MPETENADDPYLTGRFLIAMPGMPDPRFSKSLIYMCAHGPEGAMGLVVNKPLETISFPDLLSQLEIPVPPAGAGIDVLFGGPVESGRGFVLHSSDYMIDGSMAVDDDVALTSTVDILRVIASGDGPKDRLLALGYAGWGAGQLDDEIRANGWLSVDADPGLLFATAAAEKWDRAMAKIGIDPRMLSDNAGHA
ncbi:MAG: YqgE/AlgH family protein [Proteobacteria bacterium]|nr:YqgE/AlgH family protein [Pseudomonadota bacterium]